MIPCSLISNILYFIGAEKEDSGRGLHVLDIESDNIQSMALYHWHHGMIIQKVGWIVISFYFHTHNILNFLILVDFVPSVVKQTCGI